MVNLKSSRVACEEWKQTFPEPPTPYEELSFQEGWNAAVTEMMNKLLKELAHEHNRKGHK